MKKKHSLTISAICLFLIAAMAVPTVAWFAGIKNAADPGIGGGSVIQQYFHCGDGSADDPFVITRPIHYYHLVELYLRNPSGFATSNYHFQLGYDLDGDGDKEVYDYDSTGYTDGSYSETLNMGYYTGDLALVPIGTSDYPFDGVFDGSGLTVANLSVYAAEYVNGVLTGSNDIGIFGCVLNKNGTTVIKDTYFENVTISLDGAKCAYGTLTGVDSASVHTEKNVCIGTIIGHLYNYTNAQDRDYTTQTATTPASPISKVYVNNITITGGATSDTVCDYGLIGHVETTDQLTAQSIRKYVEGSELYGSGEESWGGSIDMTELFTRVTAQIRSAQNSRIRHYPTSEKIVESSSSYLAPLTTINSFSSTNMTSDYGSVYYWSASNNSTGITFDSTGGAIYGTDSGGEWNYLYGLSSAKVSTTSYTKNGATVTAYYVFDSGCYLGADANAAYGDASIAATGVKAQKNAVILIPKVVSGKTYYYYYFNNLEYYLTIDSSKTGVKFVNIPEGSADSAYAAISSWQKNDQGNFYTVSGGTNYYLSFEGAWTVTGNSVRYSITDGAGHYLTATTEEVRNVGSAGDSYVWRMDVVSGKYVFYFVSLASDNTAEYYYLYIQNGELAMCQATGSDADKAAHGWTYSERTTEGSVPTMKLSATLGATEYFLCYDGGWKVEYRGYTISVKGTESYLKTSYAAGVTTVSTTGASGATIYQLEIKDATVGIKVLMNGTNYYLSCVGENLVLTDTPTYWSQEGEKLYRTVDSVKYYLCNRNGWKVCPDGGFYIDAYDAESGTHRYLSLDDKGKLTVANRAEAAQIWRLSGNKIVTPAGDSICYLDYNEAGLLLTTDAASAQNWTISYTEIYCQPSATYTDDKIFISYNGDGFGISVASPNAKTICNTSDALATDHYLTYNILYKSTDGAGNIQNYLAVDGNKAAACNWIIRGTGSNVLIYTYVGKDCFYLNLAEDTLCLSKTAANWTSETLSGQQVYKLNGYYLSYEEPVWTLIDRTESFKVKYNDLYLFSNGTGLGVATDEDIANWWVRDGIDGDVYTVIGGTKYFLVWQEQTVKVKASGESNQIVNAYKTVVPTVVSASSYTEGSCSWTEDENGHYYTLICGVKFYLYFDEDNYKWALEETDCYEIKSGSYYLTYRQLPENLSAEVITFSEGKLLRSEEENHQWHIEDGYLYTLLGGTAYYLSFDDPTATAQESKVYMSTEKTRAGYSISSDYLANKVDKMALRLIYLDDGVTLPAEYTRVEYLESKDNQVIDTGIASSSNITVSFDMDVVARKSKYIYGSVANEGDYAFNGMFSGSSDIHLEVGYTTDNSAKFATSVSSGNLVRVNMTQTISTHSDGKKYIDSTIVYSSSEQSGTATPSMVITGKMEPLGNIQIFGAIRCDETNKKFYQEYFGAGARLYRFSIYDSGVLVRDFIPVIRNDGVCGLYDLVEGKFYVDFTGSENENTALTQAERSQIPEGYTAVSYVESPGNIILDTGVQDSKTVTIDCDVEVKIEQKNSSGEYMFGSRQNGSGYVYNGFYVNKNYISLEFAYADYTSSLISKSPRVRMTQVLSNDKNSVTVTLNGTTKTISIASTTMAATANIYLFGAQFSGGGSRYVGAGMKVYRFTIKDNNSVVRDYIPVRRDSDGAFGLLDIHSSEKTFLLVCAGNLEANTPLDNGQILEITNKGYTILSYIESTGNEYIDTEIQDGMDVTVNCDVEGPLGIKSYIFGSTQNSTNWAYNGLFSDTAKYNLETNYTNGVSTTTTRVCMTQTLSDDGQSLLVSINGNEPVSITRSAIGSAGTILIFSARWAAGGYRYFGAGAKVYRFTIKKNGETVRDLVPVRRNSDGMYGLYDLVSGRFFTGGQNNFAYGDSPFYMVPNNGYSQISYGSNYLNYTISGSKYILSNGTMTGNARYQYYRFQLSKDSTTGSYYIQLGSSDRYLTTKGTGSTYEEKGTLSYTTTKTDALWTRSGNQFSRVIDGETYYLDFDGTKWIAMPNRVQVDFRYIYSNGKYMVLNSAKNGIDTATTLDNTNALHRWFVDGTKLYAQVGSTKYYLTWSETAGFGITTTSSKATALTIPTSATASIKISGTDLYIVNDDSGWNVSISGGNYIYSGSSYINATSATAVAIQSSGKTRWRTANNKVYSYYAGKIVYWTTTNGSSISLTNSSSGSTAWTVSGGQYSTVYNGTTYYLYLNGSTLSLTGPKGYFIYALIVPTYTNGPDHSYMYHPSDTETSPKNMNTSNMTEALGGLWTVSGNLIYFTYTSGSTTKTSYLTYNNTTSPVSSGSGTSFNLGSSTNNVAWSYDATTHRLKMTKGSVTGYVALRVANNSIQGWKLYSNDTTESIKKSDNKTSGNYFDVYMDPVYDTNKITSFSSSSQTSVDNDLYTGQYVYGIVAQTLTVTTIEKRTGFYKAFANTAIPTQTPTHTTPIARAVNFALSVAGSGYTGVKSSEAIPKQDITRTNVTLEPVFVTVNQTDANPSVSFVSTLETLYVKTTTTAKRGTYLPIKSSFTDEAKTVYTADYHAGDRNTGYIVGGTNSDPSGSGQGDIRISEYSSGNISGSYNRSYGTFSNLYTFNDVGGSTPVRINETANSYVNYEYTKEKFLEILLQNRSSVFGLHFMDAPISADRTILAESVRVLGKNYVNYELPESSIDFNVYEQGYIILYAGDYYGGNSCFFSLHKIFRNSTTQEIEQIKEIKEIYTKQGLSERGYYIYRFTDGSYMDQNGVNHDEKITDSEFAKLLASAGYNAEPVFKMSWLTNPTGGRSFSNDYIYYFEIPCNPGEYCLGSVEGQDGGYLLYLDIATNGTHGTTYNQIAKISSDPLLTEMGYRSEDDDKTLNSLFNIGFQLPDGNTPDNFSISIFYDASETVIDYTNKDEHNNPLICTIYTIDIVNLTGNSMDLYVLLLDDDDDATDSYPYRYKIMYNGAEYTDNSAYDPTTGAYYATASFVLPPATS